jgi:Cu-Zn family superoxide dismutase
MSVSFRCSALVALSLSLALFAGPARAENAKPASHPMEVELKGPQGKRVGTAKLSEVKDGVRIHVVADGLAPDSSHGLHLHESGKCEGPDFKSAGGHFNPTGKQHGTMNPKGPHAGDLPMLVADEKGHAAADFTAHGVTLAPGAKNSLRKEGGTALVIHAKADDNKTDPSGNSGDRIACGVIR